MNIIRVFPARTSYTPDDNMVRIGAQTLNLPPHDEIHISCLFTWDMDYCEYLRDQYQAVTDKPVLLGGPAYNSPCGKHIPGFYTKKGIIFTSRGCNNNCSFCIVPKREGKLIELPIKPGNIINDNNLLQCSNEHQTKLFAMLHTQKAIEFKGGLEANQMTDWFAVQLAELQAEHRLKSIWFACDTDAALIPLSNALAILRKNGFNVNRNNTYCYALCYGSDMQAEEKRLQAIYKLGAMPFAMLYQPFSRIKQSYSSDIKSWARQWQRPACIKAHMERGSSFLDY